MSLVTRNTVKAWFETVDRPTQAQFWDWLDSVKWYDEPKVYTALLNQNSSDVPTLSGEVNNTGITWTPSYDGTGRYILTASTPFTINKIRVFMGPGWNSFDPTRSAPINALINSTTEILIRTFNGVDTEDGMLNNTSIEIRIYP